MKNPPELKELFYSKVYQQGEVPADVLEECVRFRTQIYIEEGYLPEPEQSAGPDCYDAQSAHICVHAKKSGKLAGYCRMIYDEPYPLPIVQLYPGLKDCIGAKVEISRFSLQNHWRGSLRAVDMTPIFRLARELLILSHQQNLQQWSCLIDERFQKLCQRFFKMDFHILGEPQMYLGSPSVPCIIDLSESIRNNLHNPDYSAFWETRDMQAWIAEIGVR